MKKRNVLFLVLAIIILGVISISPKDMTVSAVSLNVGSSAKAMCVMEKDSKRVIATKNADAKLPMASTTKIMTAITTIQNCKDLEQFVQIDDSAVGVEGTSIYLRKGEMLKVKDLLYGLMLRSGNDSAVALACFVGGNINGFSNMMNEMAKKIGAENSNFKNPHGLHHPEHYTTAYDLALITSYALNNPIFKQIVSTKTYVIPETNKSDKRYLTNKNKLLSSLDGCCGVKTGFTTKAGRCLVSACERDGTTFVCVVLNCGPMFEESSALLNECFAEYKKVKIIDKNKEIYNEYILDNKHGKLYLYTDEDFCYLMKQSELDDLRLEYDVCLDDAKEGDNVGEIRIFLDKHLIKTLKLFTMNKIDKLIDSKTLQISEVLWEERVNEN